MSELIDKNHFHKRFLKEWEWCEKQGFNTQPLGYVEELINTEPSVQPTSTLFGYKVEHLNVIACEDCRHYIPHDKRCGFWNHGVKPFDWCSRAEGKNDETD